MNMSEKTKKNLYVERCKEYLLKGKKYFYEISQRLKFEISEKSLNTLNGYKIIMVAHILRVCYLYKQFIDEMYEFCNDTNNRMGAIDRKNEWIEYYCPTDYYHDWCSNKDGMIIFSDSRWINNSRYAYVLDWNNDDVICHTYGDESFNIDDDIDVRSTVNICYVC